MSKLEDISVQFREREEARNSYNKNDEFTSAHPNALSDGDDKGKGEKNSQVGSKTDIEERQTAKAKNKYDLNNEYNDSNA